MLLKLDQNETIKPVEAPSPFQHGQITMKSQEFSSNVAHYL